MPNLAHTDARTPDVVLKREGNTQSSGFNAVIVVVALLPIFVFGMIGAIIKSCRTLAESAKDERRGCVYMHPQAAAGAKKLPNDSACFTGIDPESSGENSAPNMCRLLVTCGQAATHRRSQRPVSAIASAAPSWATLRAAPS